VQKKGAVEFDMIVKTKFELEAELETFRRESSREILKLKSTIEEKDKELIEKKKEIINLKKELGGVLNNDDASRRLKVHLQKLTDESDNEMAESRKTISKQQKDIERLNTELNILKATEKKQSARIKQLETEMEAATKRVGHRGVSDRLYSP